jgi:hypothetical protein
MNDDYQKRRVKSTLEAGGFHRCAAGGLRIAMMIPKQAASRDS